MIEILVEEITEADMSVGAGGIAFPPTMGPNKKKKRGYSMKNAPFKNYKKGYY